MARLKHSTTGVVVECDDETAARLGGYEPAEAKKPPAKSKTEK